MTKESPAARKRPHGRKWPEVPAPPACDGVHFVYLLECADGSLYTGWTTDLAARLATHNQGKGAKYTRARLPVRLVYYERFDDEHDARSREWFIKKRMSRQQKEALVDGAGQ